MVAILESKQSKYDSSQVALAHQTNTLERYGTIPTIPSQEFLCLSSVVLSCRECVGALRAGGVHIMERANFALNFAVAPHSGTIQ